MARKSPFTDTEKQYIQHCYGKCTYAAVAKELKKDIRAIQNYVHRAGFGNADNNKNVKDIPKQVPVSFKEFLADYQLTVKAEKNGLTAGLTGPLEYEGPMRQLAGEVVAQVDRAIDEMHTYFGKKASAIHADFAQRLDFIDNHFTKFTGNAIQRVIVRLLGFEV